MDALRVFYPVWASCLRGAGGGVRKKRLKIYVVGCKPSVKIL